MAEQNANLSNVKPIYYPQETDVLNLLRSDIFNTLRCVAIGQIVSFDGTKKTCSVQILFKKTLNNGTIISYPVIGDCPVITLQGGGAALQLPITPGDQCIVFFADRPINLWMKTGGQVAPDLYRSHDFTDAICLVGVNALTSSLVNYSSNEVTLTYGTAKIGEMSNKITLQNQVTSLLTLLNGLIDVLKNLMSESSTGPIPLTSASISALEAYKANLATLLY